MLIIRTLLWFIRKIGILTVVSLLLLYVALGVTLQGLDSVIRGLNGWWLGLLVAGGVLLGWGLGRIAWPGWRVGLSALLLGSVFTIIRLANLGDTILALGQSGAEVIAALFADRHLDVEPLRPHLARLGTDLTVLLVRLSSWLVDLVGGQPAYDPVATTFIWSLTVWAVAIWAAWWVRRCQQPLVALIPAGGLLVTVLAHSRESLMPLVIFLAVLLLLTGLLKQQENERRWQQKQFGFSPEIRTDLALAILPTALALIVMAAAATTLPFRQITQFSRDLFQEQVIAGDEVAAKALGLNVEGNTNAAPETPLDTVRRGGLPRNHLLGSGPELAEQIVMVVQTNDPPPPTPEDAPPRYYWRSHTYDRYNGRGWLTGQAETTPYEAGDIVTTTDLANQRLLQQEVRLTAKQGGLLYTAGELITADQPFEAAWRSHDDLFGSTTEALVYRAESRLPAATADQLRTSDSDYPEWIRRRYLHLPDSIPNRVLTLARDLTATEPTPYDRAKAIERYLRAFPYNLDLPAPPANRDIADYFLFDLQQGYCDYYATSMVVLARAAGVPARLAVGYINGTYDRANHRYLVSEAEAHAWVEIYFPDTGWVTFEPTGGRPALEREETGLPPVPPELETPPESLSTVSTVMPNSLLWWLTPPATLLLIVAVIAAGYSLDGWRLRRLAPVTTIALIQQRLRWHAHRLHTPTQEGDTPYELMAEMIEQINYMTTRRNLSGYLRQMVDDLRPLIELYVRASYSPHHLNSTDRARAVRLWQRLRWRLWLAWLLERVGANRWGR